MDFTLLTSISEGQPLTILESFAAHKPVVATDVGNCRELLFGVNDGFGDSGILTHIMNIEEIAEAMVTLAWHKELREQMEREKKILFVTRSDTETLVNGLEAYGPAFVEQLRGMFAFAVWNEKKEELMLARDFFGIKPLFYTEVDGYFVFASEIKSILQFPGVPKKLNERALEQYLSFQYSVLEETFFEGIYRLPPGCMLFYRQGKYEICRYFQPKLQPEAGCSLADMEKKLERVL